MNNVNDKKWNRFRNQWDGLSKSEIEERMAGINMYKKEIKNQGREAVRYDGAVYICEGMWLLPNGVMLSYC